MGYLRITDISTLFSELGKLVKIDLLLRDIFGVEKKGRLFQIKILPQKFDDTLKTFSKYGREGPFSKHL